MPNCLCTQIGQEANPELAVTPNAKLTLVKLVHTIVWAFFVACIVAVPVLGHLERFAASAFCGVLVLLEVIVLVVNGLRCPLTDIARRYTQDSRDNFDIYLPEWVARHNKSIFGVLFVTGVVYAAIRWVLERT